MIDLLAALMLVGASIVMVTVSGALVWCWVNRTRLRYWKF